MNDRIKLAEARGYRRHKYSSVPMWESPSQEITVKNKPTIVHGPWLRENELPDPENDANDDYAVLEWILKDDKPFNMAMIKHLEWSAWEYKVGDFARAALKVIDNGI